MRACNLFQKSAVEYRKSINPPYSRKDLLPILATIFILVAIPLTVFAVFNIRSYQPKAASQSVRGVSGDLWADVILGQRDFGELSRGEILPYNVRKVGGVLVDRSTNPGRAYIFDAQRSRILGIDLAKCYSGSSACSADIVIGQPSLSDWGACNRDLSFQNYPTRAPASAQTLCGMDDGVNSPDEILSFIGMDLDGGRLVVPDLENHRVLVYDNPWVTNASASQVIGQTDFTGNLCNQNSASFGSPENQPTASTLCFYDLAAGSYHGVGVAIDAKGDLWVADEGNNRVLRFPKDKATGLFAKTANLVLGQDNFTSGTGWDHKGSGLNQMANPNSLRFGPDGKLYVADGGNDRVLVFTPNPDFTNGMTASGTFGTGLRVPYMGEVDPSGAGLWINDSQHGKVVLFGWDGATLKKTLNPDGGASLGEIGIDAQGNVLVARSDGTGASVYLFNNPLVNPASSLNPNRDLFSPIAPGEPNGISGRRMISGSGIAVAANQLFVSDGAARILFWNNPTSLVSGQPADGVIGQRDLETLEGNVIRGYYTQIKSDADSRIWVRTDYNVRVFQAPVKIGDKLIKIIGYPFNVLGGGQIPETRDSPGIAPTAHGEYLWISEPGNNRVFRVRDPLGSNPVVDVILGQEDATSVLPNRGQTFSEGQAPPLNFLNAPGALSFDRKGNLYVSDHSLEASGNFRLLIFTQSVIDACTENNTKVCFGPFAAKSFPEKSSQIAATWEPAFDSTNRMAVGYNAYKHGGFIGYYDDPTGPEILPTGYLRDFTILPLGATFDKFDNLYIVDGNRSRVLIYKNPFNTDPGITPDPTIPPVTNVFKKITLGSDDAVDSCFLELTGDNLWIGYNPSCSKNLTTGFRFTDLHIPRGAKITNAALIFSPNNAVPALNLKLKGVADPDVATFSTSNNPANLPTTVAYADWNITSFGSYEFTSKITSIVQELVDQENWESGKSMAFVISNNGSATAGPLISFERDSSWANIGELVITYETSDITPPTVAITSPAVGAAVSGTVAVAATASDNTGVTEVDFLVDGTLNTTDTTSPYSFSWNTTAYSNGSHTLSAKAYDAANNIGTSATITVNVSNAGKIGDINGDGKVDIFDLSIILTRWGSSDTAADLNKNGTVDIFDLSILLSHWGI